MCDGVNVLNPLEGKKEQFINAFVKFYGEEYRNHITKKFDDTTFIFLPKMCSIDDIFEHCSTYFTNKIENTYKKLDEEFGVDLSYPLDQRKHLPMDVFECVKAIKNGDKLSYDQQFIIEKFADAFNIKLTHKPFSDQYLTKSLHPVCDKMEGYCNLYEKKYCLTVDECIQEFIEVREKLHKVLPDIAKIEENIKQLKRESVGLFYKKLLTSLGIDSNSDIATAHFEPFYELALMGRVPPTATATQKKNYIQLFKFLGINNGKVNSKDFTKYSFYVNNDEIKKLIFTKELKVEMQNINVVEILEKIDKNEVYKQARAMIQSLDIKHKQDKERMIYGMYDMAYSSAALGGLMYSYLDKNNNLKQVIFCRDYFSAMPSCIIHEFNHAIENNLIFENDYFYITKTGFDVIFNSKFLDLDLNNVPKEFKQPRVSRYFNEIVNEYFTSKIFKRLSSQNIKFGACDSSISLYDKGFLIFNGLIDKNVKKIIDIRLSKDSELLQRYLGEDSEKIYEIADNVIKNPMYYDVYMVASEAEGKIKDVATSGYKECSKFAYTEKFFDWSFDAKKAFADIRFVDSVGEKIAQMPKLRDKDFSIKKEVVANLQIEKE